MKPKGHLKVIRGGWFSGMSKVAQAVIIVAVILGATQLERFITHGTLLGYQLRRVEQKSSYTKNPLGSASNTPQPSESCKKLTEKDVSKILNSKVERIGGAFGDRTEPTFVSSCIYRATEKGMRSVTVILRDAKDEAAAQKSLEITSKLKGVEQVNKLGDEAYFNPTAQQLTVRSKKRIATVTVSKPTAESKISSKDAALKMAEQLL